MTKAGHLGEIGRRVVGGGRCVDGRSSQAHWRRRAIKEGRGMGAVEQVTEVNGG